MALPIVRAWSGLDYKFTGSSANEARLVVSHLYKIQSNFRAHFSSYKPEGEIKTEAMILRYMPRAGVGSGTKVGIFDNIDKITDLYNELKGATLVLNVKNPTEEDLQTIHGRFTPGVTYDAISTQITRILPSSVVTAGNRNAAILFLLLSIDATDTETRLNSIVADPEFEGMFGGTKIEDVDITPRFADVSSKSVRFEAWIQWMPEFERTEKSLQGKFISEAAASNILDEAAISRVDVRDAAMRLYAYANKTGQVQAQEDFQTKYDEFVATLKESDGTTAIPIQVIQALRPSMLSKKRIPLQTMLNVKRDDEAGGMETDVDAPTREFERDMAQADTSASSVRETTRHMLFGTFAALFGTYPEPLDIGDEQDETPTFESQKPNQFVAYGAIVYNGRMTQLLPMEPKLKAETVRSDAIKLVTQLFMTNRIPITLFALTSKMNELLSKADSIADPPRGWSVLARVEKARQIELEYEPVVVDYGTSSSSDYFGTGTNVSMITDCAFIAARVLNKMADNNKFTSMSVISPDPPADASGVENGQEFWNAPFRVTGSRDYIEDIEIITRELKNEVDAAYAGHCMVRTADLGRILTATLVNQSLRQRIQSLAVSPSGPRFYSLVYSKQYEGPSEKAMAKFYHKIWAKELGNHAVAQGGARLEESHMMTPFLVMATSDSEHVVPTLCAFDDWIGPTEMYFRLEQTALMEVENYSHSRPSIKYARGGVGRMLTDVGAWVQSRKQAEGPLSMEMIIKEVPPAYTENATTCCAMLLSAIQAHTMFTEDTPRKGGLARQRASETTVRALAERVAKLPRSS